MPVPLRFTTSLDDSNFMLGLKNMENAAATFSKGITIGAAAITGLAAIGNSAIQAASAIADASAAANIGGEDFQRLSFALSQSGTKAEQFTVGMQTLTGNIQQARDGNEKAIASFMRLGISMETVRNNDTKEILLLIADGMKESTNKAESMTAALDLLGKGGKKLVAGLKDGREAIEGIGESARIISERDLALLDAAGDRIARTWQGVKATIAGVVASALRGPFGDGGQNPELDAINTKLAEEQRAEAEIADYREQKQSELEAQREKEWNRQLERAKFLYDAEKQAAKDLVSLNKANADYAAQETESQLISNKLIKERTEELKKAAKESALDILKNAQDAADSKLAAAKQKQQSAKDAADGALQAGIRGGLQTAAERRAEAMAEKRVAREERRLERILANPDKKIGGKTGDAQRAKELRDARNVVNLAAKEVTLAESSVTALAAAIDKLIVKP